MNTPTSCFLFTVLVAILHVQSSSLSPDLTSINPNDVQPFQLFGSSICVYESTMAVGAPGDNTKGFNAGAVYMFQYLGGIWTQNSKLVASVLSTDDKFGQSVSVFEETLVIGAVNKLRIISSVGHLQAGAVFIFRRSGTLWSENQQLLANDGKAYDHFGSSVSLYDNVLVVGASDDNLDDDTSSGSVYLFVRSTSSSTFIERDNRHSFDADDRDKFGHDVMVFGDVAVVGAYQDDDQGSRSGSVYVYSIVSDSFAFQQKITASDHEDDNVRDAFGFSLSLFNYTLAVSAFFDDDSGYEAGAVYMYTRSEGSASWTAQAKLSTNDVGTEGSFGYSVDLYLNYLVVGSTGADNDAGMAHVFQWSGSAWQEKFSMVAPDRQSSDAFGFAVSIFDTHIAFTAPLNDINGNYDAGSVYSARNVDFPTSQPSVSSQPSPQPSGRPSSAPVSSAPSLAPVTSSPSLAPVVHPTSLPSSSVPSLSPSQARISNGGSGSGGDGAGTIDIVIIIMSTIFGTVVMGYMFIKLFLIVKQKLNDKSAAVAGMQPVVAEVEVINPPITTPRNETATIASIVGIEEVTPSPRKKKKKRNNHSDASRTPVLPFATHVGDHIPVASEMS